MLAADDSSGEEVQVQPVSADALKRFDHLPAAGRISEYEARLAADQDLIWRLQLSGYEGSDWEELASALVEYGFQVIRAWIRSGRIFAECRAKGLGGDLMAEQDPDWWEDDPTELAWDTNTEALRAFRDNVLLKNRWTSTKGASLKTFYIGQTLIQFVGMYRRWLRQRRATASGLAVEYAGHISVAGPEGTVMDRDLVAMEMAQIADPITRQVLILTAQGYKQDEIAELLSIDSARAVEAALYRQRHRRRRRVGA